MTMIDVFSGGALSHFSVFALGIMPYITASIIMQLMQGVIPTVGRWAKEGEPSGVENHSDHALAHPGPWPYQRSGLSAALPVRTVTA